MCIYLYIYITGVCGYRTYVLHDTEQIVIFFIYMLDRNRILPESTQRGNGQRTDLRLNVDSETTSDIYLWV